MPSEPGQLDFPFAALILQDRVARLPNRKVPHEDGTLRLGKSSPIGKLHSEDWFAELYRNLPVDDSDFPVRCDSYDEVFLRELASSSQKPSLLDPRVNHVSRCSWCLRRLMELRQESPRPQPWAKAPMIVGTASVLILLFVAVVAVFLHNRHSTDQIATASAPTTPVRQTIDLSNSATTRGGSAQLSLVTLPKRTVDLTLILPVLSQTGTYSIAVEKNREGSDRVAAATGSATQQGQQTKLEVALHLEGIAPGLYYLSTTHETDDAVYYYPLRIVP